MVSFMVSSVLGLVLSVSSRTIKGETDYLGVEGEKIVVRDLLVSWLFGSEGAGELMI
jgi:hypothetical protein